MLIPADFRRPKLPPSHFIDTESTEPSISDTQGVDDSRTSGHSLHSIKPSIPTKLGVPVFSKRKIRDVETFGAREGEVEMKSEKETLKICKQQGISFSQRPQGSNSTSIAGDTAVVPPKEKRVCAEREKNTNKKLKVATTKSIVDESSERCSLLKKKKKAPDCSQPRIQKLEMFSTTGTSNAIIESNTHAKQSPEDKSLLVNGSIEQEEQQASPKTKDENAQKVATSGEKKLARGEKKTIDSETNQKKVLSKHAAGKLSDLTVPELKVFLSENKAKVSGKKEELVQRVVLLLSSLKAP